jgi:TolA-binding protein
MRKFLTIALLVGGVCVAPALAQSNIDGNLGGRVGKLESEMRAVQRKVFPGGGGTLIEPQINPTQAPPRDVGSPASSAVDDLTQRVSSLEGQMATMTGQIEQAQYRLRQLEDSFNAYRKETDARLSTGGAAPVSSGGEFGGATPVTPPAVRPAAQAPVVQDPARGAQVATVARPSTGDAPEDEYLYGYRLWAARLYPEAETQLKKVVADYPKHRRASYAQNLLGRAYLDDGKPSMASIAFYDNYKKMPDGERAPDSLFYLGQSLVKLNKPADACKVYGELTDVYAGKIAASMQSDIARARTAAKCK